MSEYEWTCAGCGVPSPNKMRSCDCPTNVVCWDRKAAWKSDGKEPVIVTDEMVARAHAEYHRVLGDATRSDPMRAALQAALIT